jgi:endonuclease YncB( thermonuclease family)
MLKINNKIFGFCSRREFIKLIVLAVVVGFWYFGQPYVESTGGSGGSEIQANLVGGDSVLVTKVVDGDTFHYSVGGETHTVRLLGVDTPETKDPRKPVQCFGTAASAETSSLIDGKIVRLEKDVKADNLDKYGRELRYVYLPDGRMLNRILVAEGFAFATPQYPFSLSDEFVNLQKEADNGGKGLWGSCPIN